MKTVPHKEREKETNRETKEKKKYKLDAKLGKDITPKVRKKTKLEEKQLLQKGKCGRKFSSCVRVRYRLNYSLNINILNFS